MIVPYSIRPSLYRLWYNNLGKGTGKFDNITDYSLNQIWNGKSFEKFRSYMNKGCNGCKMLSKCNKCVAQSFKYFGNGCSPTPYCIKKGDLLNLKYIDKYRGVLKNKFNINL